MRNTTYLDSGSMISNTAQSIQEAQEIKVFDILCQEAYNAATDTTRATLADLVQRTMQGEFSRQETCDALRGFIAATTDDAEWLFDQGEVEEFDDISEAMDRVFGPETVNGPNIIGFISKAFGVA